jgi:hypothetical protein
MEPFNHEGREAQIALALRLVAEPPPSMIRRAIEKRSER